MKNPTAKALLTTACTAGLLGLAIGSAPLYAANPCSPCAPKTVTQQGNPCAAKPQAMNPCAAKPATMNPCAAKPATNPCAAKNPCAAMNPCAAR